MTPNPLAPDPAIDIEIDRKLAKDRLRDYVELAWPIIDSAPFVPNWHIDAVSEHLQAVTEGQIENLLINVWPGSSKSLVTCVLWPTWEWGPTEDPAVSWMFASYDQELSTRDSVKARNLVTSTWYRERWPHVMIKRDHGEKTFYETTKKGYRLSTSVRGRGTGMHPSRFVCDDAHNVEKAESDTERKQVIRWWQLTMGARGAAADIKMRKVVVMQRLHEADLSGHILKNERESFVHLLIPMHYDPKRSKVTVIGWKDPRTVEGQLGDEKRFPAATVKAIEKRLGVYGASGQLEQSPEPHGGGEIKREHWRYYDHKHPPTCTMEMQSWDTQLKDTEESARTAALCLGRRGSDVVLLDGLFESLSFSGLLTAVMNWKKLHPRALKKVMEDTSSGPALESLLRRRLRGLVMRKVPQASKIMRLRAVAPLNEAGNVWVPGIKIAHGVWEPAYEWVSALIEQCALGMNAQYKDLMDAYSQGLAELEPAVWNYEQDEAEARKEEEADALTPLEKRRLEMAAKMTAIRKGKDADSEGSSRMRYMR